MNEGWVCLNGKICPENQALIPVSDRGFLFGEGMFTTLRVDQGKCELFNGHLQRLSEQAGALGFDYAPQSFDWLEELIVRNQAVEGTWRLKIIVTAKKEGKSVKAGNLAAIIEPYQGKSMEPGSLCLFPSPVERPTAPIKSLCYLDHLQIRNYAQQLGCHDAVTTNARGFLLETGCSNLFWIDQGILSFPDPELRYLKGVFLKSLLNHSPFPYQAVKIPFEGLPSSASVYMCNSLSHVRPVLSIGNTCFPRNLEWEIMLQEATEKALQNDHLAIFSS